MYNVSNAYKSQMSGAVFKFDLEGRLTNTGAFYADNILAGSLSITNQCSSGDKIIMGSVYAGELRATFVDTNDIVVGDTITVSESMWVDSLDRYETVPLGAFKVAESVRTRSGIEVVAYDYMSKFNKKAELAQVYGTPFEWLRYCCSMCGVTMAQTQAEIEALPNGLASFECYMREDFECTYRDVVSWLAQIIGGFATMDRQGQVKLVSYAMAQTPVYDVRAYSRYNDYSFSLHTTEWDAIKYLYVAGGTEEEETVGTPTSEDTTFDFGYNPFLQNRADASTMLTNLLSVVESMTYVPFKIKVASGAAFDLGDLLTQFGGHAPNPTTSRYIVTCIDWKYNGGTTLSGAGKDVSIGSGGSGSSSQSSGGGGGGGGQTYSDFVGATSSADGTHGLVPAPLIADREKLLKGDGTWAEVERELTEAEYEALSYAEKMDGTTYYLTNAIGAGGVNGSSPFIDMSNFIVSVARFRGSTSYTATENCYVSLYLVLTSGSTRVKIDGVGLVTFYGTSGTMGRPYGVYLQAGQTISIEDANTGVDSVYNVIGLLGNNYSTTEHKTGRKWIDGSDIWEKTIYYSSVINSSAIIDNTITSNNTRYFVCEEISYVVNNSYRGNGLPIEVAIISGGVAIDVNNAPSGISISEFYVTVRYTKI